MKLKALRIGGFKSFADPVELRFHGGVTGVVGPNGCGKSNIADALRWVLGNQNPRALRADRMEDVIFAGSSSRKAMGMAEVVVTLDNSDGSIPVEFEEVSIARRLFRSGESEYLLNGSRCRLMDITDMLADCGLGSNGYWILETEMVKAILSSRTEERRFLFDEAAGITKYKVQRHRAQLKLDATSSDLDRLEDIISEVGRSVDQLRKQTALLARYEKALAAANALEAEIAGRVARGVRSELGEFSTRLVGLKRIEEDLSAASIAASARLSEARTALELAQATLDRRQIQVSSLEKRLSETESLSLVENERATAARTRSEELLARAEELEKKSKELEERITRSTERLAALAGRRAAAESLAEAAGGLAEEASLSFDSSRSGRDSAKTVALEARANLDRLRTAVESAARERERVSIERARLGEESGRISNERSALAGRLAELDSASTSVAGSLASAAAESTILDASIEEAVVELDACRDRLAELTERERDAAGQRKSLESELAREAGGTIAASLVMKEGFELAAGACLDAFGSAMACARGELDGFENGRYAIDIGETTEAVPPGTIRLSDMIEEGPAEARSVLSRAAVAVDRQAALSLLASGTSFTIVTPGGDLLRQEGLVRFGAGHADKGPLERKALLKSLERRLEGIRTEIAGLVHRRDLVAGRRAGLQSSRSELSVRMLDYQKSSSSCSAEARSLGERDSLLAGRLAEIERQLGSLPPPCEESASGLEQEIETAREAEKNSVEAAEALEVLLLERSQALARASQEKERTAYEAEKLRMEIRSTNDELARDSAARREYSEEAGVLRTRAQESSATADSHSTASLQAREEASVIRSELEQAEAGRLESLSERSSSMERAEAVEKEAAALRDRLDQARTARIECSSLVLSLEERLKSLSEKIGGGVEPDGRYSKLPDDDLASELARISGERERLGPVNMLARREYEESSQRLAFLEAQRDDLGKARLSIAEAIGEINRTAAERFDETFLKVSTYFSQIFQRFFEGGEAQLEALPGEDPLEGGVAIMARPRGKTLESISALSGGEKAMTAVALLFALYLVKPAPFCVLDELDAPLDDANVDRFIDLLDGFSKETQFIVVTHNRRTMESADRLYGVTMAGNGVSALASVSLEEAKRSDGD